MRFRERPEWRARRPRIACQRSYGRWKRDSIVKKGSGLMAPGPLVRSAGEAVPRLGEQEPYDAGRHAMVDSLERPTTISVRASEKRLELLDALGLMQSGLDTANTAKAAILAAGGKRATAPDGRQPAHMPRLTSGAVRRVGMSSPSAAGARRVCAVSRAMLRVLSLIDAPIGIEGRGSTPVGPA